MKMTTENLKTALNKKISFALLSGAMVFQSETLIKRWANLPGHSQNIAIDEHGNTALHIAVQNSWPEATEILLNRGASTASINVEDLNVIALARNIYREYENKVILAKSYDREILLDDNTTIRFVKAKQVLDILDKYKYADNI
jgi:hypothetical protein